MRSNCTRTSTSTTNSKKAGRRKKDNDDEQESDSNSNINSNSRSHSNSNACSKSDSRTISNTNSYSHSNSRSESRSHSRSHSEAQSKSTTPLPSVVCIEGSNSVFTAMIGRVVKQSIFPKKQFLILEREYDINSKVAENCVQELKIERSKWYSVRNLVRTRLNRVRNNAQLSVRKKLFRYLEQNGVDSIDLHRVLEGRRNRDTFHWFLDHIASAVVTTRVAEQVKTIKRPNEWLTRSLEAFGLVCLENFFEMTRQQIMNRGSGEKYQALWTADGRGKSKNQGWDQAGIRRYNQLCTLVKLDREKYPIEDEVYLKNKQDERQQLEMERLRRKQDATESREHGLEAAMDDFSTTSEPDSDDE